MIFLVAGQLRGKTPLITKKKTSLLKINLPEPRETQEKWLEETTKYDH